MDSAMKNLQELLPGIDEFLITTLAKEKLSAPSEKKRLYYVERLDVLRLPPTLPPRPDGLMKNGVSSSHPNIKSSTDECAAEQRKSQSQAQSAEENGGLYDTVESPLAGVLEKFGLSETTHNGEKNGSMEEDLYEIPVGQDPSAYSEGEYSSGTDYESYSEDEDAQVYQNSAFHGTKSKSRKSKRSKTKAQESDTPSAKNFPNVSFAGELYQKWKLGKWMKRYCILDNDKNFLCFKNERETKPLHILSDFVMVYIDKDGKRNHIMRLSQLGSETLYFSAENKDKTEKWLTAINPEFPGIDRLSSLSEPPDDAPNKSTSNTNLSLSSSEGGSGDGVVKYAHQPALPNQSSPQLDPKNAKKKSGPSMMDSISSFFSMGRKKGEKLKRDLNMEEIEERELDPDALVAGIINVSSELFNHRRWVTRYCLIKQGTLICYKENSDEKEFSLPLHGLDLDSSRDAKRQLAVRLLEDSRERASLDFSEALEQGRWLSVLVKETGLGEQGSALDYCPVNDALPSPPEHDDNDGDIYDEVYDEDKNPVGNVSRNRPGSGSIRSTSSGASSSSGVYPSEVSKVPPPLPAAPPPANRERLRRSHSGRSGRGSSTSPRSSVTPEVRRSLTSPRQTPSFNSQESNSPRRTPSFNSQESSDTDSQSSDVVKCHIGPTIDQDKEVLQKTENPILSQLRNTRTRRSFQQSDRDSLQDCIGNTRKKLANLRKKRAELRAKKLNCPDLLGKKKFEEELKDLENEYQATEKELEELKEQLDEMDNIFTNKAKLGDNNISQPRDSVRKSATLPATTTRGSTEARSSATLSSISRLTDSSHKRNGTSPSRAVPGKTSCTVQFSAGVPMSTIAIRDYSKSSTSTTTGTTSRSETKVTLKTTTAHESQLVTRKMTTTTNGSSNQATRKIDLTSITQKSDSDLPSPRGGRQKVQEKLKLWEQMSTTSTC